MKIIFKKLFARTTGFFQAKMILLNSDSWIRSWRSLRRQTLTMLNLKLKMLLSAGSGDHQNNELGSSLLYTEKLLESHSFSDFLVL
jgi:hypothetical protein